MHMHSTIGPEIFALNIFQLFIFRRSSIPTKIKPCENFVHAYYISTYTRARSLDRIPCRAIGELEHQISTSEGIQQTPMSRAGATGTAGTAMAVPVFEEEKWRCWDSDFERVASYISTLRLPPFKAATMRPGQTAPSHHESWFRITSIFMV